MSFSDCLARSSCWNFSTKYYELFESYENENKNLQQTKTSMIWSDNCYKLSQNKERKV